MKPGYTRYIANGDLYYDTLLIEVPWVNRDAPRDECFMALETLDYTYGEGFERTYTSVPMHDMVLSLMDMINDEFDTEYNICFLNYYKDEKQHLGWHADDSPEMDQTHPIAVISFGAERYIYIKEKDFKGTVPKENQYLLENGSLFVMPAGFQDNHFHKIPGHDKKCGGRISLTFRKFKAIEK